MRTFRQTGVAALLFAFALALGSGQGQARDVKFVSGAAALEQGVGAYKAGYYSIALPALTFAADTGMFFGQYYLARIYADSSGPYADPGKAYKLYLRLVEENANADPDDDMRAPYVGRALTAVAGYTRKGLPEIGLVANSERAAKFLRDAANFFRDSDAQFELAKMHLTGEGVDQDRALAFHWLSTLTQQGHAGAQAFLANLLWRGKVLAKDEKRALALITVAVPNASEADRIWIEDIYHNIFCGSSASVRRQADELVEVWKRIYAPKSRSEPGERIGLGLGARSCGNGEPLPLLERQATVHAGTPETGLPSSIEASPLGENNALEGDASRSPSLGFREAGANRR